MEYKRILTSEEVKILEHDLLDIQKWIDDMIDGKINNCSKRAAREYMEIVKNEGGKSFPLDPREAFIEFTKRSTYENRGAREKRLEEEAKKSRS